MHRRRLSHHSVATRKQREQVEAVIEHLIALLDALDGDTDIERDTDTEEDDPVDHGEDDEAEMGLGDSGGVDQVLEEISFQQMMDRSRDQRWRARIKVHEEMKARGLKPRRLHYSTYTGAR